MFYVPETYNKRIIIIGQPYFQMQGVCEQMIKLEFWKKEFSARASDNFENEKEELD